MTIRLYLRVLALAALVAAVGCGPSGARPDASVVVDVGGVDGAPFGAACTTSSECPGGGYCVEGYGSHVCTYNCDEGCPDAWRCRVTTVDGTLISVCVPPAFELCTPCAGDSQCGGGVCVTLGGEAFCLPNCPFEGPCPNGYDCAPDPTNMHPGNFCVPRTSACSCTSGAQDGQVRTCSKANTIGVCAGLETCHPSAGGWTGCTAPDASPELCDGLDNDCDQLIDDSVTVATCSITVPGVGTCPGVPLCAGAAGPICQGKTPQLESCNYADDDCDLMVDEAFPNAGTLCMTGVGGCERFGVMICDTAGTATQCSAVAGTPIGELCNALDDDCNGGIDEPFANKGSPCSAGVGTCARQGNFVCNGTGTATTCSVTAGAPAPSELCNGLDDDCDTRTDEGFIDLGTGTYHSDTACGSCSIDCTVLYNLPNASGHCIGTSSPTCQVQCDPNAFELDGNAANGCELVLDPAAIYVSVDDPGAANDATCGLGPVGTGAGNHPCLTIAQGIARANTTNRPNIFVANGIYTESVTLANGRNLLGAFRADTWQRNVAATGTLILGVSSAGNHDRTVIASNITAPTVFEGFAVFGAVNAKTGGNSYAIYVSGSDSNLTIRNNTIFGGRGGPGTNGPNGVDGTSGPNATGRDPNTTVNDVSYDGHDATGAGACFALNSRQLANAGVNSCGGDDVSGGNGGGNVCPASPNANCACQSGGCTACNFETATSITGFPGQAGAGAGGGTGGTGAARGDDMIAATYPPVPNFPCYIPNGLTYGLDGVDGGFGGHGGSGAGCSAIAGGVVGGDWISGAGGNGVTGGNGGGGGGGGAGGGSKCQGCASGKDKLGGHGGGGGAGGCGGIAGGGATAGGGVFGIFIVGTVAPAVTGNTIFGGGGGVGGVGGAGGRGGIGGSGAIGGTTGVPATFCTDSAGHGGNGGDGGTGSGGGGGCGGSSFGIYTSGIGSPNYCMAAAANAFSGGGGGAGGAGGYSIVNQGGSGATGLLLGCSFN